MKVIGFTNVYYTLWSVSEPYKHYFDKYAWEWRISKTFIQNLSMNLEEAKAKVEDNYEIDLTLRGESFQWVSMGGERQSDIPVWVFPWGKAQFEEIPTSENVWQLERFYKIGLEAPMNRMSEKRRGVFCRQRLIELNALTRIDWTDSEYRTNINWGKKDSNGNLLPEVSGVVEVSYKYATAYELKGIERKRIQEKLIAESTHYFNEGEKVTLELKELSRSSFDTMYGTSYVVTYEDIEKRIFKYLGSSPLPELDDCTKIKATIKHAEYNGVKETRLQRLKQL